MIDFNPHLPYGRWPHVDIRFEDTYYFNPHLPYGRWLFSDQQIIKLHLNFNPHLPYGRWHWGHTVKCPTCGFQSTPSLRKVTIKYSYLTARNNISIHTFLTEGDHFIPWIILLMLISIHTFLTEGDLKTTFHWCTWSYFNPHLPYGRWHKRRYFRYSYRRISIHTFLTEGDCSRAVSILKQRIISIHTFLTEGDGIGKSHLICDIWFQSTPSLRKVTMQNTFKMGLDRISIHTFLTEGDYCTVWIHSRRCKFQSTPSLRKVTFSVRTSYASMCQISIHTFLTEGDAFQDASEG